MRNSNLAEKFETSSEESRPVLTSVNGGQSEIIDPLDEITHRKTKRQHIREFGGVIAIALVVIAGFKLYKAGSPSVVLTLCGCASLFCLLCIYAPRLMTPVLTIWMQFAKVLEFVMTRVLLGSMWFATFFPIGIIFKIIGKSPMTLGFEPARTSYWEDCAPARNDFMLLERQY